MKIYFERSGGFMGRDVSTVVDTNRIPPEEALSLLEKVDDSDFFCLPQSLTAGPESLSGADQLCYKITVEIAGVQHTVETLDQNAPQELQPLLDELGKIARSEGTAAASDKPSLGHNR
ncbi:MAG: hypothetical protein KIS95_11420 [Anaerolineae bacterium]|uniref:protealysin inhibitor emfourin n=1 Tax=Promineifilum sp. TaxID=2664178 RepID=UPI001D7FBDC0|nr:hypothetical protein [Anaerolineales bacterium]MCB8935885.1 hypothetical protein [Promineifilum sp.]MCO5180714.1 hypothetical protein [Promineifilum sp.]MCW5847833.1 hypothetical protein [Anaerolineae bacterium]